MLLNFIRKCKAWFIRFQLHKIVEPFSRLLLKLVYLSKLSKWISQQQHVSYNDFYATHWDYTKRFKLYDYIFTSENLTEKIVYLEFGVSTGSSFKWMLDKNKHPDSLFVGFDTFEGLPEKWGHFEAGAMSATMPIVSDARAKFIKGLFQDSLPLFLKNTFLEGRKVIMLDADLYSSTLFVLTSLAPFIKSGDIIFFDEFAVPNHEFLAFHNFLQSYYFKIELLGATNNYYFVAFKVV